MKKSFIVSLCLIAVLMFSSLLFADEKDSSSGEEPKVEVIYLVEAGVAREITFEEYYTMFKKDNFDSSVFSGKLNSAHRDNFTPKGMTDDWYRYDESGTSLVEMTNEKKIVSVVFKNASSEIASHSFSYSASSGSSHSISLSSGERSAVITGIGFEWNNSASVANSATINLRPGQYGWFEFVPIKNKSWGYVKTFNWLGKLKSQKYVVSYSPKKENGNLVGILIGKTSYSSPY